MRLHKCLYGLKQAFRNWFRNSLKPFFKPLGTSNRLRTTLSSQNITQGENFTAVLEHVDDVIVEGNDSATRTWLKKYPDTFFHIKDLGSGAFKSSQGIFSIRESTPWTAETGMIGATFKGN